MNNRSQITIWLTVSLFISLFIYSFVDLFVSNTWLDQYLSTNFYNISKLSANLVILLLFTRIKFITKLFCFISGENFIAGDYIGNSWGRKDKENVSLKQTYKESKYMNKFTIKQSIFEISITGKSYGMDDGLLNADWVGRVFKHDENHYWFGLEMNKDNNEYGILKITFDSSNEYEVEGFYYSGEPEYPVTRCLKAKRISSKEKNIQSINNQENLSEFFQDSPLAEVEIDLKRDKNLSDKNVS